MNLIVSPQYTQVIPTQIAPIPDNPTFSFMDSPKQKRVTVHIDGTPVSFVLWQGAAYDAEGDYTQAQINAAVTTYLQAHQAPAPTLAPATVTPPATPAPIASASVSSAVATSIPATPSS